LEYTVKRGAEYKWKGNVYGEKSSVYVKSLRSSVRKWPFRKVSVRRSKYHGKGVWRKNLTILR